MTKPTISFPILGEDFSINPPHFIELFGFPIYYYGIIIAFGFLLAVLYCARRSRDFGLTQDNLLDMLIIATPLAIIGARLYYVAFNFSLYEDDLMGIFSFRDGGLAIYGGIIFAVIGLFISAKRNKFSSFAMLDLGGMGLLIGQCVGRWGNFINREAFGTETDSFLRMGLTNVATGVTTYVHPTFLYESVWNFFGFIFLHIFSKKVERKFDGQLFLMYIAWYGLGRTFTEGLRTDSLYLTETIRVSQALALLSFVVSVIALIVMLRRENPPEKLWKNRK